MLVVQLAARLGWRLEDGWLAVAYANGDLLHLGLDGSARSPAFAKQGIGDLAFHGTRLLGVGTPCGIVSLELLEDEVGPSLRPELVAADERARRIQSFAYPLDAPMRPLMGYPAVKAFAPFAHGSERSVARLTDETTDDLVGHLGEALALEDERLVIPLLVALARRHHVPEPAIVATTWLIGRNFSPGEVANLREVPRRRWPRSLHVSARYRWARTRS